MDETVPPRAILGGTVGIVSTHLVQTEYIHFVRLENANRTHLQPRETVQKWWRGRGNSGHPPGREEAPTILGQGSWEVEIGGAQPQD